MDEKETRGNLHERSQERCSDDAWNLVSAFSYSHANRLVIF